MKKIYSLLGASALVLSLAACSGNKSAEADSVAQDSVIGVELEGDSTVGDFVEQAEVVAPEAAEEGVNEVKETAKATTSKVSKAVETAKTEVKKEVAKTEGAVSSKMDEAVNQTKAVAEKAVNDAKANTDALRDAKFRNR